MIKNSVRGKETVERDFEREAFSAVFLLPCIRRKLPVTGPVSLLVGKNSTWYDGVTISRGVAV